LELFRNIETDDHQKNTNDYEVLLKRDLAKFGRNGSMIDYKLISTVEIAKELGLKKGKRGKNFHCPNKSEHKHNDNTPSLSISDQPNGGFNCFGCGIKGNNVELVKQVLGLDVKEAIQWLEIRFAGYDSKELVGDRRLDDKPKKKDEKYQVRFIKKGLSKNDRFTFSPKDQLDLKVPTREDISKLRTELGKSYSLETLERAGIKVNHSDVGYGLVFPKGQLVHNPNNLDKYLHFEGRTDYLTAIELGLDEHYAIVSNFNKTAKIKLSAGQHYFVMDRDVTPQDVRGRLIVESQTEIGCVRLPQNYDDFSDYYNIGGCTQRDILALIENTPIEPISPTREPNQISSIRTFSIYSASELLTTDLPEQIWAVKDTLPAGLAVLAGRPKVGKSFMALELCLAVAQGRKALGRFDAEKGEALFIGLEDNWRRLRNRLRMMLGNDGISPQLSGVHLMTEFLKLDQGGEDQLKGILKNKPNLSLVVIDTYGKVAPYFKSKNPYLEEYAALSRLQQIGFDYETCLLMNHHTRKSESDYVLDEVLGSTAITGTADTILILKKNKYGTVLHTTGRDIEEQELAVEFDKETGLWRILGDADKIAISEQRKLVIQTLRESKIPLWPSELAKKINADRNNVKQLMWKMYKAGLIQKKKQDGKYHIYDNHDNHAS
jgi:hypothetical protein